MIKNLVVFLDIDGVMNVIGQQSDVFTKDAVRVINELGREYDAKIVISSSWREVWTFSALKDLFIKNGVTTEIIDKTPVYCGDYSMSSIDLSEMGFYEQMGEDEGRNKEIMSYVRKMGIDNYIIFDDLPFSNEELKEHLVLTNWDTGLNFGYWNQIQKIIERR